MVGRAGAGAPSIVETLTFGLALSYGGTLVPRLLTYDLACRAQLLTLFIGRRERFRELAEELRRRDGPFFHEPFYCELNPDRPAEHRQRLEEAVAAVNPDEIVLDADDLAIRQVLDQALGLLKTGCALRTRNACCERLFMETAINGLDARTLLGQGLRTACPYCLLAKRALDIAGSVMGLILFAPILGTCAVAVRLSGRGPILYRQMRVGRFG